MGDEEVKSKLPCPEGGGGEGAWFYGPFLKERLHLFLQKVEVSSAEDVGAGWDVGGGVKF